MVQIQYMAVMLQNECNIYGNKNTLISLNQNLDSIYKYVPSRTEFNAFRRG